MNKQNQTNAKKGIAKNAKPSAKSKPKNPSTSTQKNTITNYTRNKCDPIYLQLFQSRNINCEDTEPANESMEPPRVRAVNQPAANLQAPAPAANRPATPPPNATESPTVPSRATSEINSQLECELLRQRCTELESENRKLLKDNKMMKKLLKKYENVNMIKDIRLMNTQVGPDRLLFKNQEQFFNPKQLKKIRSLRKGQKADSTLVYKLVEYLFEGQDVHDLCVSNKRTGHRKPISPGKKEMIGNMLEERIDSEQITAEEKMKRNERVNALVGYAINNLRKKRASLSNMQTEPKQNSTSTAFGVTATNPTIPPPVYFTYQPFTPQ